MDCIFCLKELNNKNIPSYFAYIMYCANCPYRFFDYDNNLYFKTKLYEFSYYGFNKVKIYTPQTIIIKENKKIIIEYLSNFTKNDIINSFFKLDESNINVKIETFCLFI